MKLTENWNLVSRPVLQMFNTTPYQDQSGQLKRATGFRDTIFAFAVSPGHSLVGNWPLAAGPTCAGRGVPLRRSRREPKSLGPPSDLRTHLARAIRGQRQIVFVTGGPGIGKTTLVDEFQRQAARGATIPIAKGLCEKRI